MHRVIVIGCPGSGKSTFSRALHLKTGLPLFHLDQLNWNADRTCVERPVFLARLADAMQGPEWILDGNYRSTMELRLQACDTVFFLDYPLEICLEGIRERRGKARPDMPWQERASEEDAAFIRFVERYRTESRPEVLALLQRHSGKEIHVFTSREQAAAFLNRL